MMSLHPAGMQQSHFCAGKINWALMVGKRLCDGYHQVRTILQYIQFGDWLHVRTLSGSDTIVFSHNQDATFPIKDNLVYRAAKKLQTACGKFLGAQLYLNKRLPIGSGLGGGSSNAAITLKALNTAWGLHWPMKRLMPLARSLGCDVPFFLFGRSAYASGKGEKLRTIRMQATPVLITWTGPPSITKRIFEQFDGRKAPLHGPLLRSKSLQKSAFKNSLLETVLSSNDALAQLYHLLNHYAPTGLTGSGNALFTPCSSWYFGQMLRSKLPPEISSCMTMTCNRLPTFPHWE